MKKLSLTAVALMLPIVAGAQANDPTKNVADGGVKVSGWEARLDDASASVSNLKFVQMGSGFHVTSGPAAIYYNPSNATSGNFTAKASLTQTKVPAHREAYGIFVAGDDLKDASQNYLYFVVAHTGEFTIKHRAGAQVHTVVDWTKNGAVKTPDASGRSTNELAIEVGASDLRFLVNGTEVHKAARSGMLRAADGVAGLRVNHNLDVHVGSFSVSKM